MFARSWPFDSNRIVLAELLLSVTVAFCSAHVVHAPVPLNVMFVPTPFTTSRPVRAAVTPSANRMRSVFGDVVLAADRKLLPGLAPLAADVVEDGLFVEGSVVVQDQPAASVITVHRSLHRRQ